MLNAKMMLTESCRQNWTEAVSEEEEEEEEEEEFICQVHNNNNNNRKKDTLTGCQRGYTPINAGGQVLSRI